MRDKKNYTEGVFEDYMYDDLKSLDFKQVKKKYSNSDFAYNFSYHFSKERHKLLEWYPFKKNASLLEIGAGLGALTELFCQKVKDVTAIELTEKRSKILQLRNSKQKNLKTFTGDFFNYSNDGLFFDYVTSIGVLEYTGYSNIINPYIKFLTKIYQILKHGGCLILAIENKFGLKYWSGSKEDHTRVIFDSIQNYIFSKEKSINTFGREELISMLNKVGFEKINFYYPLPDYKFPIELFSDNYLPTLEHNIRRNIFPMSDRVGKREYYFNEQLVMDQIIINKYFPVFANSFLIFASK